MPQFDDLKYTSINDQGRVFVEVSLTHVIDRGSSEERIYIKRGHVDDGRHYKGNIAIPFDEDVAKKVAAAILKTAGVDSFDYGEVVSELEFLDG